MMKSSAMFAAAVLITGLIAGHPFAQPPVSADSFPNTGSTSWHNATFTVATNQAVYYPTDSLAVQYTITNNASATQTYGPFGGNCEYDLIVSLTDGTELYRESTNAVCLKNLTYVSVPAGGSAAHDFAKFGYPPGVDTYVAMVDSVVLTVSAQLRGTVYDSTRAGVNITIKRPSTAVFEARSHINKAGARILSHSAVLLSVPSAQHVTVDAFSPDGRMIAQVSISRRFSAGTHMLPLSYAGPAGVYIVRIKGETFEATLKAMAGASR
jgi:hypothetical protein